MSSSARTKAAILKACRDLAEEYRADNPDAATEEWPAPAGILARVRALGQEIDDRRLNALLDALVREGKLEVRLESTRPAYRVR